MYDSTDCYPVEGAKVAVENIYRSGGLKGTFKIVAKETYTTNAEGRYQVHFVEKGCVLDEKIHCNLYSFYYENKWFFGFYTEYINNYAQNNILVLDTIKLYK